MLEFRASFASPLIQCTRSTFKIVLGLTNGELLVLGDYFKRVSAILSSSSARLRTRIDEPEAAHDNIQCQECALFQQNYYFSSFYSLAFVGIKPNVFQNSLVS